MKKKKPQTQSKNSLYFRYEFSDEAGNPEGGDIFQFSSMAKLLEMATEIVKVAHSDQVAVNLTMGTTEPFHSFLKNVGMTQDNIDEEMVSPMTESADSIKKAPAKVSKKKSVKKTTSKKKA